jgi:3-oxoacyl-[acyl-carrier protein] reductase
MFDLTNKTALVTGASGGIGGAIAKVLHGQGARVVLSGTRADALDLLKAELGERAVTAPCNLGNAAEVDGLVKKAEATIGAPIDILVNNAGITRDNLLMRMTDAEWDQVIAVNLTAAFKLSRAVLRGMMKKRWGRIITITSVVGVTGNPGQGNYAAAKAGLIGMSKALAAEIASRNITVNCVAPGFIATAMTDAVTAEQRTLILARVPAGRLGESKDVAAAVAYLASEEASYVTGQTLHVNGGMAMI